MKKNGFALFIILVIIVVLAGVGYFTYKRLHTQSSTTQSTIDTSNWKTYTNTKYHYSIEYPGDWTYREFPDTQTGAGFRPANQPNDLSHEYISIDRIERLSDLQALPFEEYVKKGAIEEIQNFQSLASIKQAVTDTGLIGYTTTWTVLTMNGVPGQTHLSTPITYFDTKDANGDTIQVDSDNAHLDIYNKMLSTFTFTK